MKLNIEIETGPDDRGFVLYIDGDYKGYGIDMKDTLEQLADILMPLPPEFPAKHKIELPDVN